jgi:Carboxypeptidase regulatory-like domain
MNGLRPRLLLFLVACALATCAPGASANPSAATINGSVVSANGGGPVVGATVNATSTIPGASAVTPATTDADGNFTLSGLIVGDEYTLTISAPGFAPQSTTTYGSEGTTSLSTLDLTPDIAWGTVTDAATGESIGGELVQLLAATGTWQPDGALGAVHFSGDIQSTLSAADGSFAFPSDSSTSGKPFKLYFSPYAGTVGSTVICPRRGCSLSGYVPAYVGGGSLATATTITPGPEYNISLEPYASLTPLTVAGAISTPRSGHTSTPAANVTVELQSTAGKTIATARTQTDGVYEFGSPSGAHRVYIPPSCVSGTCYQGEYSNGVAAARLATVTRAHATLGWRATSAGGESVVYPAGTDGDGASSIDNSAGGVVLWPVVKSPPAWLKIIDYWRAEAGLLQASTNRKEDRALSAGLEQYAHYELKTPAGYKTGNYASPHVENPKSPYYTKLGAAAAGAGDLYEGLTGPAAINGWLGAPFHATAMFGADTTNFNQGNGEGFFGGLSTLGSQDGTNSDSTPEGPILFPGPGSTTTLLTYSGGEDPDPLATCGRGYEPATPGLRSSVGLPLILMNLAKVPYGVTAVLRGPTGAATSAKGGLCVEDSHDYRPGNGVLAKLYGKRFFADDQIFLIPKKPLKSGSYSVTVNRPGQSTITWAFKAASDE